MSFLKKKPALYLCILRTVFLGFPGGAFGKESTCQCKRHRDSGLIPGVGKIPWKRTWHPTPVFLPGKFHGQRSLVGYSPGGCKELDTTEHRADFVVDQKQLSDGGNGTRL